MTSQHVSGLLAIGCLIGAGFVAPPDLAGLRETTTWLIRPAALPFLWRDYGDAERSGTGAEAFARAQQILHLMPTWSDAQVVFAFRYATDGGAAVAPEAAAEAAHDRLQVALAWLETARQTAGHREVELLQAMSILPEMVARRFPGVAERMLDAGGTEAIADHYLAAAERISGSAVAREQRTFFAPLFGASLLRMGDRARAIEVLEWAIRRSRDVRDVESATEWAARLTEVLRHLRGEAVDLGAVRADPRMTPLLPYLD
ncbi:MAG: hypothetical protein NXI31_15910 [bacterium]|nr:hypothetical protein [bacterium]